jgi:hypothetical protein
MKINQYYPNVTVSLPLQTLTRYAAAEVHQEMQLRRREALQDAPIPVVELYDAALQAGAQLSTAEALKYWEGAMRRLEEGLSLYCAYELDRWLRVFRGLCLVLEREAKRRQHAKENFSRPTFLKD